jgi:hypothetical protein
MRRFVVRRKFSGARKLLCFSRRPSQFVLVATESGLEADTKCNGAGALQVSDENCSCLSGLRNTARISPARHDLNVLKLLCGSSLYCAALLWHPSASAAPAAQDFAKQRGAHHGAMITANSATIAMSAVVRRFFLESFVSPFTSLIRYLLELSRSTRFAEFGFHGAPYLACSQYPWPSFSTATFPAKERYTNVM